jgi:hypothetical protein
VNLVELDGKISSGLGRVALPRMCTNAYAHARVFLRKTLATRPFEPSAARRAAWLASSP